MLVDVGLVATVPDQAAGGRTIKGGSMARSNRWPWTPTSGAVAGRTFSSRREYRAALAEAQENHGEVGRALSRLLIALENLEDYDEQLWAATNAQTRLSYLVAATAEARYLQRNGR